MRTDIIGYSGSGKTELFRALTGPYASGEKAMVKVPEPRLEPLITLFNPGKVGYPEIEFRDLPGGGSWSLGNKVLSDMRGADCLLAVLDAFTGTLDPERQQNSLESELMVSDMAVIEKRLDRIRQDKKKAKHLHDPREEELLLSAWEALEQEKPLREFEFAGEDILKGFSFLSAKPILYAWNLDESRISGFVPPVGETNQSHIAFSAKLEREMAELEDEQELQEFMDELGVPGSVLDRVIARTYELMGLITFLTVGEKEVRAWPLRQGQSAWEAAGIVHTDIQKGFIRAEILGWNDFLHCGSFKKARETGVYRLEGKDYIVRDGDIVTFRFNL